MKPTLSGLDIGLAGQPAPQGRYSCRDHGIVQAPLLIHEDGKTTALCPYCLRDKLVGLGVRVVTPGL